MLQENQTNPSSLIALSAIMHPLTLILLLGLLTFDATLLLALLPLSLSALSQNKQALSLTASLISIPLPLETPFLLLVRTISS